VNENNFSAVQFSRMLKKCHCERFLAKQSLKIKRSLRQKTPRDDNDGIFQQSVREFHSGGTVILEKSCLIPSQVCESKKIPPE
jgi:hypothetical protein